MDILNKLIKGKEGRSTHNKGNSAKHRKKKTKRSKKSSAGGDDAKISPRGEKNPPRRPVQAQNGEVSNAERIEMAAEQSKSCVVPFAKICEMFCDNDDDRKAALVVALLLISQISGANKDFSKAALKYCLATSEQFEIGAFAEDSHTPANRGEKIKELRAEFVHVAKDVSGLVTYRGALKLTRTLCANVPAVDFFPLVPSILSGDASSALHVKVLPHNTRGGEPAIALPRKSDLWRLHAKYMYAKVFSAGCFHYPDTCMLALGDYVVSAAAREHEMKPHEIHEIGALILAGQAARAAAEIKEIFGVEIAAADLELIENEDRVAFDRGLAKPKPKKRKQRSEPEPLAPPQPETLDADEVLGLPIAEATAANKIVVGDAQNFCPVVGPESPQFYDQCVLHKNFIDDFAEKHPQTLAEKIAAVSVATMETHTAPTAKRVTEDGEQKASRQILNRQAMRVDTAPLASLVPNEVHSTLPSKTHANVMALADCLQVKDVMTSQQLHEAYAQICTPGEALSTKTLARVVFSYFAQERVVMHVLKRLFECNALWPNKGWETDPKVIFEELSDKQFFAQWYACMLLHARNLRLAYSALCTGKKMGDLLEIETLEGVNAFDPLGLLELFAY